MKTIVTIINILVLFLLLTSTLYFGVYVPYKLRPGEDKIVASNERIKIMEAKECFNPSHKN